MSVRCKGVSVPGPRLIAGGAATPTRPRCSRFVHGLFRVFTFCSRFVLLRRTGGTKGERSTNASVAVAEALPCCNVSISMTNGKHEHDARKLDHTVT